MTDGGRGLLNLPKDLVRDHCSDGRVVCGMRDCNIWSGDFKVTPTQLTHTVTTSSRDHHSLFGE